MLSFIHSSDFTVSDTALSGVPDVPEVTLPRLASLVSGKLQCSVWRPWCTGCDTAPPPPAVRRHRQITEIVHELRITYNNLHLYPAVQEARSQMLQQMFAWQNIIITLSRIQSSRYQVACHSSY